MRSFITTMTLTTKHMDDPHRNAEGADRKRKHMEKPIDPPLPRSPGRREQRLQKRRRHGLRLSTLHGYGYDREGITGNEEKGDDKEENNWDGGKEREMSPPSLSKRHGEEVLRSNRLPRYVTRGSGIAPTVIPADYGSSSDDTEFDVGEQVSCRMRLIVGARH